MRGLRWIGWIALCLPAVAAVGQDGGLYAPSALKDGALTVWYVLPPGVKGPPPRVLSKDVQQQTAGSFGQTASSYGTAASNHGQTASSLGQTAGSVGTAASDHGQTSGSFGQTASSYGTAASDHGQTAGSFGQTSSSYGQTSSSYGPDGSGTVSGTQAKTVAKAAPLPNRVRDGMQADLTRTLPDLQASFVTVTTDELKDKLAGAEGQAEYPDVIVGSSQSGDWRDITKDASIIMLGSRNVVVQESRETAGSMNAPVEAAILQRALHPGAARAFVVWLREGSRREVERPVNDASGSAASTAMVAAREVLNGGKLSAADPSLAEFAEATASTLALEPPSGAALDGVNLRISVLRASANARLAVVALRAVASSETSFGVVHPLVVLRRAQDGRWKVLQISANLGYEQLIRAYDLLSANTGHVRPAQLKPVAGITQAAPLDGDNRGPRPELWWDNGGGGSLLVVEWQWRPGATGGWTDSRMFFIPDDESRLQTRVTAQFANSAGEYHWRVWTLGAGGQVNLSPWRTVKVVLQ